MQFNIKKVHLSVSGQYTLPLNIQSIFKSTVQSAFKSTFKSTVNSTLKSTFKSTFKRFSVGVLLEQADLYSLVFFLDIQTFYQVLFAQVYSVRLTPIYLFLAIRTVL